jgi:hypothetical protein
MIHTCSLAVIDMNFLSQVELPEIRTVIEFEPRSLVNLFTGLTLTIIIAMLAVYAIRKNA